MLNFLNKFTLAFVDLCRILKGALSVQGANIMLDMDDGSEERKLRAWGLFKRGHNQKWRMQV